MRENSSLLYFQRFGFIVWQHKVTICLIFFLRVPTIFFSIFIQLDQIDGLKSRCAFLFLFSFFLHRKLRFLICEDHFIEFLDCRSSCFSLFLAFFHEQSLVFELWCSLGSNCPVNCSYFLRSIFWGILKSAEYADCPWIEARGHWNRWRAIQIRNMRALKASKLILFWDQLYSDYLRWAIENNLNFKFYKVWI